jgi:hypothetical protein
MDNEEQKGPFTIDDLKNENITEETYLWCEGMGSWEKAKQIPQLKELFQIKKTPTPPKFVEVVEDGTDSMPKLTIKNKVENKKIKCPKCKSEQLTTTKKGFSGTQAVGGAILTGGIGILAGTIGSNKLRISCLACGHQFKPGEDLENARIKRKQERIKIKKEHEEMKSPFFWIFWIPIIIFIVWFLTEC